jgi:hypothetical protein
MKESLDELYFRWLYAQVGVLRSINPARTHWKLAKQLYFKEFVWFVPNDDNRAEDGKYLRHEFLNDCQIKDPDPAWMSLGCSMLEMLIALSRRLAFMAEGEPRDWFWELLHNIGLDKSSIGDVYYNTVLRRTVDEILDVVIWRRYSSKGDGGLFPLPDSDQDQRKIEIWYQLNAYLANEL